MFSILLVTSCLLLLFYFCCFTITITTFITTATTTVSHLPLIPLCKQVFILGAVELTTQLSKPVRILWLPRCRINKLGYLAREDYLDPLQLRVISYAPKISTPKRGDPIHFMRSMHRRKRAKTNRTCRAQRSS